MAIGQRLSNGTEKLSRRSVLGEFVRYVVGGGVATLIHLTVLTVLVEKFRLRPTVGTSLGFCVGSVFNYAFQYYLTFRAKGLHAGIFVRYAIVTVIMLGLNAALFDWLTKILGLPYLYAQMLATSVIMLFNFAINKLYTFSRSP
jgi:putative flippase GtrA